MFKHSFYTTSMAVVFTLMGMHYTAQAQSTGVGINTDNTDPDGSAILDVKSTNRGILIPRMLEAERNAITSPATGLLIFQTDVTPGFYYFDGAIWRPIAPSDTDWTVNGNDMYNNNTGNTGVGDATPGSKLDVNGNINIDNGNFLHLSNGDNTTEWGVRADGESFSLVEADDSNKEYIRIDDNGPLILKPNGVVSATFSNDQTVEFEGSLRFDCASCGDVNNLDGTGDWGDLTIQGRVLSANSNLHLSPPNGFDVIINDNYRAAGGTGGGTDTHLRIEDGGIQMRKRYRYFQRYYYSSSSSGVDQGGTHDLGNWDFCAVAHVGFKNNASSTDEDDDVQCAVYPSSNSAGVGEQTNYDLNFVHGHDSRPFWRMYLEAYEDTNGVTCSANCINFDGLNH